MNPRQIIRAARRVKGAVSDRALDYWSDCLVRAGHFGSTEPSRAFLLTIIYGTKTIITEA